MRNISRRALARYSVDEIIAGASSKQVASHIAAALIETKKTKQLPQLIEDIAYELEDRQLATTAAITTAHALDGTLRKQIENFITKKTGAKNISLHESVDSSLIGGVHIETAKYSWDQSVKRKLTDIGGAF